MLRLLQLCPRCRKLEDRIEELQRQLSQERDKRLTARLVNLSNSRKARKEPTWGETLQQAERLLRDYLSALPEDQREWRVPGNQDLRAVRSAIDTLTGFEGLQKAQQETFMQTLSAHLDHCFPGNLLSDCLADKGKLTDLLAQLQEETHG